MIILDTNKIEHIIHGSIQYLIEIVKISDFLAINELTQTIISLIEEKVTIINCFDVYKLTNVFPFHKTIRNFCLNMMMININQYYSIHTHNDTILPDPYAKKYELLPLMDIKLMLTIPKHVSPVTKISVLKNWLIGNRYESWNEEDVFNILEYVNVDASYSPRCQIKFMRKIRDQIIAQILQNQL